MTKNKKQPDTITSYIDRRNEILEAIKDNPLIQNMSWEKYQEWKRLKQLKNK